MEADMEQFKKQIAAKNETLNKMRQQYKRLIKLGATAKAKIVAIDAESVKIDLKYLNARLGALEYAAGIRPITGPYVQQGMLLKTPPGKTGSPTNEVDGERG